MRCPYCGKEETSVIESRPMNGEIGVRRRRECGKCGKRFTTFEQVGNIEMKVIKRSGEVEEFDRAKVERGIVKACWKREVAPEVIQSVVDGVEMKLLNRKSTSIKSTDIGKMVLNRLKKIDSLAYLRFASVYLDVDNIKDFKEIINQLEDIKHA